MLIYLFSFYFGVLTLPRVSSFSRQMTCKSMKLFHRSFLLHLAVRLGHEAFIAHFIAPLIEAAGGDRDLTPPPVEATNVARSEGGVVFCCLVCSWSWEWWLRFVLWLRNDDLLRVAWRCIVSEYGHRQFCTGIIFNWNWKHYLHFTILFWHLHRHVWGNE